MRLGRPATALTLAGAGAVTAHLAPGLTRSPWLRDRLPGLNGDGDPGHVALTFDDGPDPKSTPTFLRRLDELDVRATFFLLGQMVQRAPGLARTLADEGHEVAVHGWGHRSLAARGPRSTARDLAAARDLIEQTTGQRLTWWRPPYGVLTLGGLHTAREMSLTPVLWSCWGEDWTAHASPASVIDTLERRRRPGATVLLHDSSCTSADGAWRSALGALPELVARCRDDGLDVGPLRDHGLGTCRSRS